MKLYYPVLLFVSIIALSFSLTKNNYAKKSLNRYELILRDLQSESKNYLNSLINVSDINDDAKIILTTNDTLSIANLKKPCLCYFYSSSECMSCVEENIFELLKLEKNKNLFNIYIISTIENFEYLKIMSKTHISDSLIFCYWANKEIVTPSFYFMIFNNGVISNIYYPIKGESKTTLKYLKKASTKLNVKNIF